MERTDQQITSDYIDATQEKWDDFIKDMNELWVKMKRDINLPSQGVDVFSSKAEILWGQFRNRTSQSREKYETELNELKLC